MSTTYRLVRRARAARQDPMLTRLCIGVLVLFPMVTVTLLTVVRSLPIAMVMAGLGAVTVLSFLPRAGRRKA